MISSTCRLINDNHIHKAGRRPSERKTCASRLRILVSGRSESYYLSNPHSSRTLWPSSKAISYSVSVMMACLT